MLTRLLYRHTTGDKAVSVRNIRSKIAGVFKLRRRYSDVNLFSPRVAQQFDDPAGRSASYDRIVYHYDPFSFDSVSHGVELYFKRPLALRLRRLDKGSSYISVFYKSNAVRYLRFPRISERRVETRIRYSDHHVGVDRTLLRQILTRVQSRSVNALAVYHAVRTREIDIFKHA